MSAIIQQTQHPHTFHLTENKENELETSQNLSLRLAPLLKHCMDRFISVKTPLPLPDLHFIGEKDLKIIKYDYPNCATKKIDGALSRKKRNNTKRLEPQMQTPETEKKDTGMWVVFARFVCM